MSNRESKVASPAELQALYESALREQRARYGAAPTTVEALIYELRTEGIAQLKKQNTQRRLAELTVEQVQQVIDRLFQARPENPKIDDALISKLKEQIQ